MWITLPLGESLCQPVLINLFESFLWTKVEAGMWLPVNICFCLTFFPLPRSSCIFFERLFGGQRSLVDSSPWSRKESDTTEWLTHTGFVYMIELTLRCCDVGCYLLRHLWAKTSAYWADSSLNRIFSSVQSLSRVWLIATPWITACQASLSITNTRSLLKLMSIESVMPSSHLILCRPVLLLPPVPPSITVFLALYNLLMWNLSVCLRAKPFWVFYTNFLK